MGRKVGLETMTPKFLLSLWLISLLVTIFGYNSFESPFSELRLYFNPVDYLEFLQGIFIGGRKRQIIMQGAQCGSVFAKKKLLYD